MLDLETPPPRCISPRLPDYLTGAPDKIGCATKSNNNNNTQTFWVMICHPPRTTRHVKTRQTSGKKVLMNKVNGNVITVLQLYKNTAFLVYLLALVSFGLQINSIDFLTRVYFFSNHYLFHILVNKPYSVIRVISLSWYDRVNLNLNDIPFRCLTCIQESKCHIVFASVDELLQ